MVKFILCPFVKEKTPSLAIYPDGGYFCFSCRKYGKVTELGLRMPTGDVNYEKPKEDIQKKLSYIASLPVRSIRGFMLPADSLFYYILWPNRSYYKARFFNATGSDKYRNPVGHRPPLFVAREGVSSTLVIIEGELNALSVAACEGPYDVCSPGTAGDFYSTIGVSHLTFYTKYKTILLVVDKDTAGVIGAINLKSMLLKHTPNVIISMWDKDANELFQETNGKQLISERIKKDLDLSRGMPSKEEAVPTPREPAKTRKGW